VGDRNRKRLELRVQEKAKITNALILRGSRRSGVSANFSINSTSLNENPSRFNFSTTNGERSRKIPIY